VSEQRRELRQLKKKSWRRGKIQPQSFLTIGTKCVAKKKNLSRHRGKCRLLKEQHELTGTIHNKAKMSTVLASFKTIVLGIHKKLKKKINKVRVKD
jgi:hypothetical protein